MAAKHILVIPHQNPDGDALGSAGALMQWLTTLDKPHTAFCATLSSPRLTHLPHADRITTDHSIWQNPVFDTIIVVDSGDLRYAGVAAFIDTLALKPTIINFDHHATNEHFGTYNMVDSSMSSTTEMLYHFFRHNDVTIDTTMATSLLTGLMTDTDSFTNGATSHRSLAIGSELIKKGGSLEHIRHKIFQDKSVNTLKVWGNVLARLTKHEELDVVYTYLTREDLKQYDVKETDAEGIANFLNNLADGRAGMFLKELETGEYKGSFRTTRNDTDVSAWAKALGGGGHKKAAGFTVPGPIESAINTVFTKVGESEGKGEMKK